MALAILEYEEAPVHLTEKTDVFGGDFDGAHTVICPHADPPTQLATPSGNPQLPAMPAHFPPCPQGAVADPRSHLVDAAGFIAPAPRAYPAFSAVAIGRDAKQWRRDPPVSGRGAGLSLLRCIKVLLVCHPPKNSKGILVLNWLCRSRLWP
jgi:hypothetical protein